MSNTRRVFRVAALRFVVIALTGAAFFTIASTGTAAASLSFIDSVSIFFSPAAGAASVDMGASAPNSGANLIPSSDPVTGGEREFRGVPVSGNPDTFVFYAIELIAHGDETVVCISLQFDQTRLSISGVSGTNINPDVLIGSGAPPGSVGVVNAMQVGMGRIGVLLDFARTPIGAGTKQIAVLRFRILPGAPAGLTPVTFVNRPIVSSSSNLNADDLVAKYTPSYINVTSGPTPTPTPSGSISGTVFYGTTPVGQPMKFVPDVLLTAAGSAPVAASTDDSGAYLLSGLGSGPYTVTRSKSGDLNGISALDAAHVAQHLAGLIVLSPNQQIVGDATNNGSLSALDASRIAQTAAGRTNPGIAGHWKFIPGSKSYPSVPNSMTNEDYEAILVGDVTGNWEPPSTAGAGIINESETWVSNSGESSLIGPVVWNRNGKKSDDVISVDLPSDVISAAGTPVALPIRIGDATGKGVVAYEFTLDFDPNVLRPMVAMAGTAGTLSEGWSVTENSEVPGRIRVVAYGMQELIGAGTLLNLNFAVMGSGNATTPLNWTGFRFNEDEVLSGALDSDLMISGWR